MTRPSEMSSSKERASGWSDLVVFGSIGIIIVRLAYLKSLADLSFAYNQMSDFGLFYFAMKNWLAGASLYAPNAASFWIPGLTLLDLAPPHFHFLIWPLTWGSQATAFWTWFLTNLGAMLASVWIAVPHTTTWRQRFAFVLPLLAFVLLTQASHTLWLGQYDWLLAIPATLAWRALREERWERGFAWAGVVLSMKPFPIVLLWLAWRRRQWRASIWMFGVAGAIACLSVAVFGLGAYFEWLSTLQQASNDLWWLADSMSVSGVWKRLFVANPRFAPLVLSSGAATFATLVSSAVLLWQIVRLQRSSDIDRDVVVLLLVAFLLSPIAWSHYLVLLIGPVVALAVKAQWFERKLFWTTALASLVTPVWFEALPKSPLVTLVGGGWACGVALGLLLLALSSERRGGPDHQQSNAYS